MLLLPAAASASDPATDQYSPSTPGGGGNVPVDETDGDFSGGAAGGNSGSGSGGDDGGADAAPAATAPTPTDDAAAATGATGGEKPSRDERTLGALAAQGKAERDAQAQVASASGASTDLIRSESDDGGGLGPVLWVVLGLTLAGAIWVGISRRRAGGHPA